jgi:hypothetical protein
MLFAQRYLFWSPSVPSLAVSREPVGRCVSAFHYLWQVPGTGHLLRQRLRLALRGWRLRFGDSYSFDCYLDTLEAAAHSETMYRPLSLKFRTHTASMWDDIVDEDERILVSHIVRIERLYDGLDEFLDACGIGRKVDRSVRSKNVWQGRRYVPTPIQRRRIERLYAKDCDIYESTSASP